MKIDLSTPLRTPKGEPFTQIAMDGNSIYRLFQFWRGEGISLADAVKRVEEQVGGKDFLRPMSLGDAFYRAVEVSPKYASGAAAEKRELGKLLDKLVKEGEVEFTEAEKKRLTEAIEEPGTFNGAMLVAIDRVMTAAQAREDEEAERAKENAKKGAALTAVGSEGTG